MKNTDIPTINDDDIFDKPTWKSNINDKNKDGTKRKKSVSSDNKGGTRRKNSINSDKNKKEEEEDIFDKPMSKTNTVNDKKQI